MPPDFCADHTKVIEAIGRIEGRGEMMLAKLDSIDAKLSNGEQRATNDRILVAIDRAKMKPIFWALSIVGSGILLFVVSVFIKLFQGK